MTSSAEAQSFCATKPFDNPFQQVGVQHGEGLDRILAEFQKAPPPASGETRTRAEGLEVVRVSFEQFVSENGATTELIERVESAVVSLQAAKDQVDPLAGIPSIELLSEPQRSFIRRIIAAVGTNQSVELRRQAVDREARRALSHLGLTEASPVLLSAAVATSSMTYWEERDQEWIAAVRRFSGAQKPGTNTAGESAIQGGKIVKEDVKGAVAGAIAGAITGAGAAVSTLAGGLAGSAVEAIDQLWDWFFDDDDDDEEEEEED
jgi:hypothetical protein